ncbi:MAG: ribonuclease III [Planctomycetes bacterium]|nr:ribonuclease III [Planctomycetota bacterium]NBY01755.1 ribonuclease III [Planctomycetota bacterium]
MSNENKPRQEIDPLEDCQKVIGYQFKQTDLLKSALTHASGVDSRLASNERLEFLGDSILGLICCEFLYHRFPDLQEGDMTKIKSVVVSRPTCAKVSEDLKLGSFMVLGRGVAYNSQSIPANILADVFEAILGAIYLDGGWIAAKDFALRQLSSLIEDVAGSDLKNNAKSLLQQIVQREFGTSPQYILIDENGPDHSKCFMMAVSIQGKTYKGAWGKNKKDAEQSAAFNALAQIQNQTLEP